MARKASRRGAASKGKKSSAAKGRKSSATKRAGGAKRTARSASAGQRKTVSVDRFVRSIRTLHDLGLVKTFVQAAKSAKLTLTMDAAAFERVKSSVNRLRQAPPASTGIPTSPPLAAPASIGLETASVEPPPGGDPFGFGSNTAPGGLGGVKPLPGKDPFDF